MPTTLQNLRRLIDALEADKLPPKFRWNFNHGLVETHCGFAGCAMGLAKIIGIVDHPGYEHVAEAIGIDYGTAHDIFIPDCNHEAPDWDDDDHDPDEGDRCPFYDGAHFGEITPQMVAEKLRQFLPESE